MQKRNLSIHLSVYLSAMEASIVTSVSPCLLECLQLCSMSDVLEVRCVLPEVLLDFGVEGMVGGDHQGRMVAHLAKVL